MFGTFVFMFKLLYRIAFVFLQRVKKFLPRASLQT